MRTEVHSSDLLTITEAANLLRVAPRTIRNRIRQGLLPARNLTGSRTLRVERADVLAQLEPLTKTSPLIDRLATPEGRAHALAVLDASTEGDAAEQRETLALLMRAEWEYPFSLRGAVLTNAGDDI